jgi:hypothetical protein
LLYHNDHNMLEDARKDFKADNYNWGNPYK